LWIEETQKNRLWRHEPLGGPSTPPGGFWKFPENTTKFNETPIYTFQHIQNNKKTYT